LVELLDGTCAVRATAPADSAVKFTLAEDGHMAVESGPTLVGAEGFELAPTETCLP
jgi:hypothetical protein